MQENRAWERNAQRLVALLVTDQVDDVLIEKGFKIGATRQTELAQRLLTNGNGLADQLLWLCVLRSSFFGRLCLGFGDVHGLCQLVQLPCLQPCGQRAQSTGRTIGRESCRERDCTIVEMLVVS